MKQEGAFLLRRQEVTTLLGLGVCITAVERSFKSHAEGWIEQGAVTRASVQAELAEVVVGAKTGRTSQEEIIIFESTGTALQDVAAAELVCEKEVVAGNYPRLNFAM